ncbi:Endopolyphosphatase [Pleosporales sp. CAS-2024a]
MLRRGALLGGLLLWPPSPSHAAPSQGRRLTGKFLHITDFHPDPYYKTYASTAADAACHRQRGPAGLYGAETSACDSPYALVNQTFQWINDHLKHDIDFVVWTGDSARHDNDEALPRTPDQVVQQNEYMVAKFAEVFGNPDAAHGPVDTWAIPIVPTFGNNDIMPHNIFLAGPNHWTQTYLHVWRGLIPEAQRHQFSQGGWFSVEVVPARLAVISLNTIFFFSSNSAVDGCANKHEPGYEHMEWLRIQLHMLRHRGMKAILMGHVPPARVDSKESWDETCWQKYTLWQRQFRDVIVGSLYGHMNIDHFMLQDFHDITPDAEKGRMASGSHMDKRQDASAIHLYDDGEVTVASASDYLLDLRDAWAQLPAPPTKSDKNDSRSTVVAHDEDASSMCAWLASKWRASSSKNGKTEKSDDKKKYLEQIGGKFAERYSVSHVAPSVVPNYYPTLRIIEYNITGLDSSTFFTSSSFQASRPAVHDNQQPLVASEDSDDDYEYTSATDTALKKNKNKTTTTTKKGPRKYKFKVPEGPSKSSPPGPAYSPQTFTWTRYTQYFANLTHINNDFVDNSDTVSANRDSPVSIFGLNVTDGQIENTRWKEGKHGKHQGKQPRPEPHPNPFVYEVEYDTKNDGKFPDLTVRRWVEYARRIGTTGAKDKAADSAETEGKKHKKRKKHRKASKEWHTFVKRAFVGTMDPKEIEELFVP